jgi:uncharacterized protein YdeI (BOF family)
MSNGRNCFIFSPKKNGNAGAILHAPELDCAKTEKCHNDEPTPPPNKQEAGLKCAEDAMQTSVAAANKMRSNAWVSLEGHIEKKVGMNDIC